MIPQQYKTEKEPVVGADATETDDPLKLFLAQKEKAYASSYAGRVEAQQKGLKPLYDKINEGSAEDAKTNALLLLADAGFKFASTTAATPAMALAQSLQGIPKGLASIAAQARDRRIKIDMAVLEHSMTRVDAEDDYARKLQFKLADYAKAIDVEHLKQLAKSGAKIENYPGGMLKTTDRVNGSFMGLSINPDSALYQSATDPYHPYALSPSRPFVKDMGPTNMTPIEDADMRKELEKHYQATNTVLSLTDQLIGEVHTAYGPGAAIVSAWNNTLVPFGAPLNKSNARAEARIKLIIERLKRNVGSGDLTGAGKQAVSELEGAKAVLDLNPNEFFSSPEAAAQKVNTLRTTFLNMRQEDNEKFGFSKHSYRATVPPSGTSADPFIVPADKTEASYLLRHLAQTYAPLVDPKAAIYLQYPNGSVKPVSPAFLTTLSTKIGAE